jgi:hypothetical protein
MNDLEESKTVALLLGALDSGFSADALYSA